MEGQCGWSRAMAEGQCGSSRAMWRARRPALHRTCSSECFAAREIVAAQTIHSRPGNPAAPKSLEHKRFTPLLRRRGEESKTSATRVFFAGFLVFSSHRTALYGIRRHSGIASRWKQSGNGGARLDHAPA
jgi:hypothetical protein